MHSTNTVTVTLESFYLLHEVLPGLDHGESRIYNLSMINPWTTHVKVSSCYNHDNFFYFYTNISRTDAQTPMRRQPEALVQNLDPGLVCGRKWTKN